MDTAVLHICDYAAAYRGNFVESLQRLETALAAKGVAQVYLFPYRANHTKAKEWIAQMRREGRAVYVQERSLFGNLRLLRRIKKQHHVTVVLRHFFDNTMDLLVPPVFGKRRVIRFIHGMYDVSATAPMHRLRRWLYRREVLVGVSQAVTDDLARLFLRSRVVNVTNAVCFDRLDSTPALPRTEAISCMVMGYNSRVKGVDLALRAVNALRERHDVTLSIVAASHLEELKTAITQTLGEIPAWVQILPPREDVAAYYKSVDIFLAPSRSEGFSYAVVEATACGASVVFSDIAAHRLLKVDTRYRFESENMAAFTETLERAVRECRTEETAARKAQWAEQVRQEYAIDRWVAQVCALIEK